MFQQEGSEWAKVSMLGVLEGSSRYKSRVAKEGKSEVREVVGTQL
jgi:hypothetical protein